MTEFYHRGERIQSIIAINLACFIQTTKGTAYANVYDGFRAFGLQQPLYDLRLVRTPEKLSRQTANGRRSRQLGGGVF